MFPKFSIVVVNWNLREDTLACLDSVLAAGVIPQQIILVDNASEDGSVEAIRARFGSALNILQMETNLGFAGGNNAGIRRALAEGAEWIFLLNNDTVIAPEMFTTLQATAQNHPEYGILAPLIFYYQTPTLIWYLGHRLVPGTLITRPILSKKPLPVGSPPVIEVDFLVGCGVMIRRDVFERVGLLDEALFMYAEETEFFWRTRLAGFRMACVTPAHMWHKVSLSANRDRPKTRYFRIRNQILFYRNYARGFQKPLMWMFTGMRTLAMSLLDLLRGYPTLFSASWQGFGEGWWGVPPVALHVQQTQGKTNRIRGIQKEGDQNGNSRL